MPFARSRERPEEAHPEHQHTQQGISPGDPGVEAVAQRDLEDSQEDHAGEEQGEERILDPVQAADSAREPAREPATCALAALRRTLCVVG